MSDALVHAELLAACSALGYTDGAVYHREADCLETTKDLVRYLRRDDESHEVRRALGDTRVLQTDLLPLVRDYSNDTEQFDVTIRLLVNLTNPVLLLFREELPEEKVTRQQYLRLVTQQQRYKEAFVDERLWSVLVGRLGELLQLDWEHRQEEDRLLVERILILIRNVLSVPASPEDEKRTDDDSSVHDQVLWALHLAGLEDLLLYVASSQSEQDLCMHVLEIISLMLREQDPAQLAQAGLHRSDKEKEKDEKELLEVRRREALQRQQQRNKYYGARHSRFGGTYYVQNMKSISDRDLISHQPLTDIKSLNFDRSKKPKKHPKHRKPMKDADITRRSTLAIRLMLQEFCIEFLNGAYNSIMYIVKDNLSRARAQEHDESYYLWAMRFFMAFNRHHQFKVELISETLSVETFHYIQTQLENYFETMATDKKKIPLWSRRMHKALRAYQELLMTLAAMDKSEVSGVRESSRVLKSRVFYVIEYREMILLLLQNYNPIKMSLSFLKDVVETAHIFLKLLEGFCGKNRHLVVQKKAKKPKQKKGLTGSRQVEEMTEDKLQDLWDEMAGEVSAWVQGEAGDLPDTVPFDPLSEQSEEEQKEIAMRRINKLLRNKELAEAVSLMRSAREVWPEGDVFGAANLDHSDEFLALREVFMANLNPPQQSVDKYNEEEEEEEEEYEEEEEEERMMQISEQEFSFKDFVRRFANSKVIESYSKLLETYETNSSQTNHCILKLFHRIAWDCKLPAMFFQASLFVTFQRAMDDSQNSTNNTVREIAKFAKYIIRQFFKVLETNPKVYMELLFWKTNKEAMEIECGYGDVEEGALKKAWREEEEEELRRLYEEMNTLPVEERGGKDIADLVLENLINQSRSRRAIIKKMKELGLIQAVRELKGKPTQLRVPRQWSEDEEAELRILFEEHKDAMDIVGRIMDNKMSQRPKNRVVEKILELGLVADKKELRKKRPKKVKPKVDTRGLGEKFLEANQGSDDDDDSGNDNSGEGSEHSDSESDDEHLSQTQRQATKKSSGPASNTPVATPALISEALKEVVEAGMGEVLEWLGGVISDVASDREEDGDFEPVPILALTEACTNAMEDPKFHKLLHLVGLQPPRNHQEMYWRVPSRLTVPALRKRASYLTQGASGDPIEFEKPNEPLEPVEDEPAVEKSMKKKSSKKAKEDKIESKTSKKKIKLRSPSDTEVLSSEDKENHYSKEEKVSLPPTHTNSRIDDSDDDMEVLPSSSSIPSSLSQKRILNNEDDSNSDSENTPKTQRKESKKKKRRLVIAEDSDEDSQTQPPKSQNLILHLETEPTERMVDDQPNTSPKPPSGRKLLDSDDDDGDVPLVVGRQRVRAVVESDDDE
ncbi:hypothetical protein Pcinc_018372 [Petrolisthes cinctipes]|uniref:Protein timeless homolog n=1 Tax=Petrolisthes cinctipes TaxID=88211 RepID=A0AAE1KJ80_PETCI|nr:hypothetical protein Pcinc_018372 [Petrolisthes cinctipes]